MIQTQHPTLQALIKQIKKDFNLGVTQIAVTVVEDKETDTKEYHYARPYPKVEDNEDE